MNVLIYTQSYYARNTFVNALIPKGITLYHIEHSEDVIKKISADKPEIIVLDVIQEDYASTFELIKEIKSNPSEEMKKIPVILLIGGIDKQSITAAIQVGVVGFIKSNATEEFVSNYISEIYQKMKGIPPERKFVRISMDSNDPSRRVGIKFRSSVNSQLIIGVMKDISFGGIAAELVGTYPPESIAVGQEIKNIQFILDGRDLYVDAVVVAYKDNKFCAFRFSDMPNAVKETISHFIFDRVTAASSIKEASREEKQSEKSGSPAPEEAKNAAPEQKK
jgi:DNA-binding NarL/FixJ family response regulator